MMIKRIKSYVEENCVNYLSKGISQEYTSMDVNETYIFNCLSKIHL